MFELAPVALAKLRSKGNDVLKLNMKDICAIAHRYLAKDLDAKLKKLDLVLALQALMAAREHVLPAVVLEAGATPHCGHGHGDRGHANGRRQRGACKRRRALSWGMGGL